MTELRLQSQKGRRLFFHRVIIEVEGSSSRSMTEEAKEKPLQPSKALLGTGAAQYFTDSLSRRYINLFAVAIGTTVSQMGYLRGAQSLSQNILQLLWGRMVDRHGKRVFIALGRLLNGAILATIIFVRAPSWLIPSVIGASICVSLAMPSWSSLLGDYTAHLTRGETIGRINAVSNAGGLAAMISAFVISLNQTGETTPESFTWVLAMAATMSIVSGVLILFAREKTPISERRPFEMSKVFKDPRLRRYLIFNTFYGVSMSFAWPLFPFVVVDKLAIKVWQVAAYSVCSSAFSAFSQRYIGTMMDRIGRRPVIVFSRVAMSISPLVYAFATSWLHIFLAEVILGVGMGAWMSSSPTYIIDMAPGELRATYLATNTTVFGISAFIGSLASGYITDNFFAFGGSFEGINLGLLISAALRFSTGLLFLKIYETFPKPSNRTSS